MILESSADWKAAVHSAASIDDIFDVFSGLFGGPGGQDFKRGFQRAERLKRAVEILKDKEGSGVVERYDAAAYALNNAEPGIISMAGLAQEEAREALWYKNRPELNEVGRHLRTVNTEIGAVMLAEAGAEIALEKRQEIKDRLKALEAKRYAAAKSILDAWEEERGRVEKDTGLEDLNKEFDDFITRKKDFRLDWVSRGSNLNQPPFSSVDERLEYEKAQLAKWNKLCQQEDAIQEKLCKLRDEHLRPLRVKRDKGIADSDKPFLEESAKLEAALKEQTAKFSESVKKALFKESPVSEAEATDWATKQSIDKSAIQRLKKGGYAEEALRADMAEFYRLTGGKLSAASVATKGQMRANADPKTGVVRLGSNFNKRVLFHEMAHLLERNVKAYGMAVDFRDSRVKGFRTKRLSKITGNRGYRSNEFAYEDSFFDPYVGKVYPYASTEVLSMGMQMLSTPESMITLYERDPEMLSLMLGFAASEMTELDKIHRDEFAKAIDKTKGHEDALADFYKRLESIVKKKGSFWQNSGLVVGIEKHPVRYWQKKSNSAFVSYRLPADGADDGLRSEIFKNMKNALSYAYLYLLYLQKGISVNAQRMYYLAQAVDSQSTPPDVKPEDLPTFLDEELKGFV